MIAFREHPYFFAKAEKTCHSDAIYHRPIKAIKFSFDQDVQNYRGDQLAALFFMVGRVGNLTGKFVDDQFVTLRDVAQKMGGGTAPLHVSHGFTGSDATLTGVHLVCRLTGKDAMSVNSL